MALPVDLVVFDMMGTLIKDMGSMETALKGVVTHHSIPHTEGDLLAMRGAGKRAAFQALVARTVGVRRGPEWSRAKAEEMYATFKQMLKDGYEKGPVSEIPGAEAAMRWLRENRVKIASSSAVDADLIGPLLERLGWANGIFDCKITNQDVPAGRPAPYMIFAAMMRTGVTNVRRVAVVGDTVVDMQAGMNAGAGWVIGVLSGACKLESMGTTAHTHILASVAELPKLLESR